MIEPDRQRRQAIEAKQGGKKTRRKQGEPKPRPEKPAKKKPAKKKR